MAVIERYHWTRDFGVILFAWRDSSHWDVRFIGYLLQVRLGHLDIEMEF